MTQDQPAIENPPRNDGEAANPAPPPARRARRGTWKLKLLAVLLPIALVLAAAEIGLRVAWHNSYRHETTQPHLKLGIQAANRDYLVDRSMIDQELTRARLRTDDRSYIMPSFQYEDPDATIVFMGGSTTECAVVQEELRFPALVSTLLAEEGLEVNSLNAGASGNTVHESINALLNHVAFDEPDIVVLMNATNDLGILARFDGYHVRGGKPIKGSDAVAWLKQEISRYCYLFAITRKALSSRGIRRVTADELRQRNSIVWADMVPVDEYRARLVIFVQMCRQLGIKPVLMTQPLSSARNSLTPEWHDLGGQDRFNATIRRVGVAEQVPVIDLATYVLTEVPEAKEPMVVFYDGMHVTDKGSRIYAEYLAKKLRPMVLDAQAFPRERRKRRPPEQTAEKKYWR